MIPEVISFLSPYYLLGIPVLLIILYIVRKTAVDRWTELLIPGATGFLLLLSASQPEIPAGERPHHIYLAVDVSRRIQPDYETLVERVHKIIASQNEMDRISIFLYGEEGDWWIRNRDPDEIQMTRNRFQEIRNEIKRQMPRHNRALNQVTGAFQTNENNQMVMLTDGYNLESNLSEMTTTLRRTRTHVTVQPWGPEDPDDLWIESVRYPSVISPGEQFEIVTELAASRNYTGRLVLREKNSSGEELVSRPFDVSPPQNRTLRITVEGDPSKSIHQYRLDVMPEEPGSVWKEQNMSLEIAVSVSGTKTVRWITGNEPSGSSGAQLETDSTSLLIQSSLSDGDIAQSDVIILSTGSRQLSSGQRKTIAERVREGKIGLIMTGGEESFGAGGWGQTPIADVVPVDMYPPDQTSFLSLIDISGSMTRPVQSNSEQRRIDLMRQGILRQMRHMGDRDRFGVIGFASEPTLLNPLSPFRDITNLRQKVMRIEPGGGTQLAPALREGVRQMKERGSGQKIIMIFTDGVLDESAQQLESIARSAFDENIRILFLTHENPGAPYISALAAEGNMGTHLTFSSYEHLDDRFEQIIRKERNYFSREQKRVRYRNETDYIPGNEQDRPRSVNLYNRVSPAYEGQEIPLTTGEDDEILVVGEQMEQGRSVAFTPVPNPGDSTSASGDEPDQRASRWTRVLKQNMAWVQPEGHHQNIRVRPHYARDQLQIQLHWTDPESQPVPFTRSEISLFPLDNGGENLQKSGVQVNTGTFAFQFPRPEPGLYDVSGTMIQKDGTAHKVDTLLSVPFSPSLINPGWQTHALRNLAESTGGTYREDGTVPSLPDTYRRADRGMSLVPYLLLGAIAGFLLWPLKRYG